jgi:hypothetical protein
MILSDAGAGLCTLVIAVLLMVDRLDIWHIYLTMATSSAFRSFQLPAYFASLTVLVPKRHYGRASGMMQLERAASNAFAPVLGALLLGVMQMHGVILIDVATFLCALVTLLWVQIPRPETTQAGRTGQGSLWRETVYGWTYIMARPGLLALLWFFATNNLLTGMGAVLLTPLVLSFTSAAVLGTVLSISGGGFLLGSLVMSVWGGPQCHIYGIFSATVVRGLCLMVAGLYPSAPVIAVAMGLFFFNLPIAASCSQAIWQKKVAPDVQGRVYAVRKVFAWSAYPLAYLLAGPLADYVFEPLLAADGLLAGSIGRLIGVGPGRGIGLLYIVVGALSMLQIALSALSPRLRLVDEELPDVMADAPPE